MRKWHSFEDRFIPEPNSGCWLWIGRLTQDGYGQTDIGRRVYQAHRWSYEKYREPIPPGLVIDHLCRTRSCVNPWHLEPVTNVENIRRGHSPAMRSKRSDVCRKGHPRSPENTYIGPTGRICRRCNNEAAKRYAARKKKVTIENAA